MAALTAATAGFAVTLRTVGEADWDAPTPNPGWTVRHLVDHVVGGNRRYLLLLAGAPVEEVEALRAGPPLGPDPVADFEQTAAAVIEAFTDPATRSMTVHHRKGDRSGSDLLSMRILEHALHGWDLATAVAGAAATVDPAVASVVLERIDADPTLLRRSGYPQPTAPVLEEDPALRLLRLSGRG